MISFLFIFLLVFILLTIQRKIANFLEDKIKYRKTGEEK